MSLPADRHDRCRPAADRHFVRFDGLSSGPVYSPRERRAVVCRAVEGPSERIALPAEA